LTVARATRIDNLKATSPFRFIEEAAWTGFPYRVDPRGANVAGVEEFGPGERPVVIHREGGRYPRYGSVKGCYPVKGPDGSVRHWVVKAEIEVLVPSWHTQLAQALLTLLAVSLALLSLWWFLGRSL